MMAANRAVWIPILLIVAGASAAVVWTVNSNTRTSDSAVSKVSDTAVAPVTETLVKSSANSISELIGPLEARLNKNPEDPSSWVLLAKSFDYLGQPDRAREAYEKAANYGSLDKAVVTALKSRSVVSGKNPLDVKSMQQIGDRISQLDSDASQQQSHARVVISGEITIAPELLGRVPSERRVFVYAKASGGKGMPLAVMQTTASEFPLSYRLDDSMAMMAGQALGIDKSVEVTARVSLTGNAISQPGDLVAQSAPFSLNAVNKVDLVIDRVFTN